MNYELLNHLNESQIGILNAEREIGGMYWSEYEEGYEPELTRCIQLVEEEIYKFKKAWYDIWATGGINYEQFDESETEDFNQILTLIRNINENILYYLKGHRYDSQMDTTIGLPESEKLTSIF